MTNRNLIKIEFCVDVDYDKTTLQQVLSDISNMISEYEFIGKLPNLSDLEASRYTGNGEWEKLEWV